MSEDSNLNEMLTRKRLGQGIFLPEPLSRITELFH